MPTHRTLFQFLIVRLKFSIFSLCFFVECVSIPYSTIKIERGAAGSEDTHAFQFLIVRLKLDGFRGIVGSFLFQFLIVRLKLQHVRQGHVHHRLVSIPYSTIKMITAIGYTVTDDEFQFLIVRLKLTHI